MSAPKKYLATDGNLSTLLDNASAAGSLVVDLLMKKAVATVEVTLDDGKTITIEPSDHVSLADFCNELFS